MIKKVLIKRGKQPTKEILKDGEIAYNKIKKCFYVGDGKTLMNEIHEFTSLVASKNGKIYAVSVDENGIPSAKPTKVYSYAFDENGADLYVE